MKCPCCGRDLNILTHIHEIPYFGKIAIFTVICECGFKKTDIEYLEEKKFKKHILKVESEKDLEAKIVRSSYGKIEIPELGLELLPGPAAEGFITNVEGLLMRFEWALEMLLKWKLEEGDIDAYNKGLEVKEKIKLAKEGKIPFTVIVEDETGNSLIAHPNVIRE